MKRAIVTSVAALMAFSSVATFSSCGEKDNRLTITFYHTMGQNLRNVLDKYIAEFNDLYPDIKIVHDTMGDYDGVREQIATELLGGNSPSIAYCYPDHVALYNKSKKVIALDDYISSTKEITLANGTTEIQGFTQAQIDDFIDAYYEEGKVYGDDKMYTLPFTKSTEVMYYNKTFFEENNLSVPTTWDEMETLCAQIKTLTTRTQYDANGNPVKNDDGTDKTFSDIPLGYDSESNWFITMTEQLGTPYTSSSSDDPFVFNTKENREFVKKFRSWYENGYVTTEEIYGGYTSDLFTETDVNKQKCYMCIGSSAGASYQCPDLENKTSVDEDGNEVEESVYPFEVGVAQIPQANPEQPKVIQQGPSLCIFKKSQEEMDAAWAFVKFLTTNVNLQAEISMTNGYTPVIKSVQNNTVYQNFLSQADGNAFLQATSVQQTLAQADAYYISPAFEGSSEARTQVGNLLQNCFLHEVAAGQTVDALIEAEFKTIIDTLKYKFA